MEGTKKYCHDLSIKPDKNGKRVTKKKRNKCCLFFTANSLIYGLDLNFIHFQEKQHRHRILSNLTGIPHEMKRHDVDNHKIV